MSQYNFTIDEANENEQEIAVDPEMLGKIFESLLDDEERIMCTLKEIAMIRLAFE